MVIQVVSENNGLALPSSLPKAEADDAAGYICNFAFPFVSLTSIACNLVQLSIISGLSIFLVVSTDWRS